MNVSIKTIVNRSLACVFPFLLMACTINTEKDFGASKAIINPLSHMSAELEGLPLPARVVDVSVYDFPDMTGQQRPNDKYADYSKAVTQGGAIFLIDALKRTGKGKWFRVAQRSTLKNLLQERQIVDIGRAQTLGKRAGKLPSLVFAGVILDGGILAYEADTITGGAGARLLGIGAHAQYRQDQVTVGLVLTSVQTGEILQTVTTTKTIYSVGLTGSVSHYVAVDHLLEIDTGLTRNEPAQLAVREAIESAVYSLVMQGGLDKLWDFVDPAAGRKAMQLYLERKNRPIDPEELATASDPVVKAAVITTPLKTSNAGKSPASAAPLPSKPILTRRPVAKTAPSEVSTTAPVQPGETFAPGTLPKPAVPQLPDRAMVPSPAQ